MGTSVVDIPVISPYSLYIHAILDKKLETIPQFGTPHAFTSRRFNSRSLDCLNQRITTYYKGMRGEVFQGFLSGIFIIGYMVLKAKLDELKTSAALIAGSGKNWHISS